MFLAGSAGFICLEATDLRCEQQEIDWNKIRQQYPDANSTILNLNNGSAGMISSAVERQLVTLLREMNKMAPYEAKGVWSEISRKSKLKLAQLIGAKKEEIAIVRNTTEALNYVLRGIEIPKHSNVVCAKHDYSSALNILKRLAKEKNFTLKYVDITLPASKDEIIKSYDEKIDENCSLVLLTAMTHREGQILPIKEITKLAKAKGALVVVDAAHALGHFEHSVVDWNCDYYCSSLHKWLSCPIGSGLLYMKSELIPYTEGSFSANKNLVGRMIKFEDVGTKPFAIEASILSALSFQEKIGLKVKSDRLRALTDYWVNGMKNITHLKTYKPEEYGGVCSFYCPGDSVEIMSYLNSKKIHVKKVFDNNYKNNKSRYRVSPNIYHGFNDLDRLTEAMETYEIKK